MLTAFSQKSLKTLLDPRILVEELDVHISDPAFAARAVEILDGMIKAGKT